MYGEPQRCTFMMIEVTFVCSIVSGDKADPSKIEAITSWPIPSNITKVRSFHDLTFFYRRFIRDYNTIMAPIPKSAKKGTFEWIKAAREAFELMKEKMCKTPMLTLPKFCKPFEKECDVNEKEVRGNMERASKKYKQQTDKGVRKAHIFEVGNLVWIHWRKKKFSGHRKHQLMPRDEGPFEIVAKVGNNAYKIDLGGKHDIAGTFKARDLAPYLDDDELRAILFEEGGNDVEIKNPKQTKDPPFTKAFFKSNSKEFQSHESSLTHEIASLRRKKLRSDVKLKDGRKKLHENDGCMACMAK